MGELTDLEDVDLADLEEAYYRELMESNDIILESGGFYQTLRSCFWPTVSQTSEAVLPLLGLCLIIRIVALARVPHCVVHFVSNITGVVALFMFCKWGSIICVSLALVGYIILRVAPGYRGTTLAVISVLFMIASELFFIESTKWNNIRGPVMIIVMKQISLGFDIDVGLVTRVPNSLQYFGYVHCASSVIFGPFVTYQEYTQITMAKRISALWIFGVVRSFVSAFIFLVLSVCVAPFIFKENSYKRLDVARPQHVEIPRSLVEVVIHWNVAIHTFLKNYVFKKTQSLGRFVAIFLTFFASSLLHGLNFQLSAVLLSIGMYGYIEYVLRQRLGNIFNACILARRCRPGCNHTYKETNFWVSVVNLGFGFLALFHLAYLGIMFGDTEGQEKGMEHTLNKWSHLGFASHWVALGCFILYRILGP